MGPIKHGGGKAGSNTQAKCRLFEQREDIVKKVLERMNERHLFFPLLSQTEQAEALVVTGTAVLTLSTHAQAEECIWRAHNIASLES
jgi:hypothetical protein